jgi:hypothetical protein
LYPGEEIVVARAVHDGVRRVAGHIEIHLARGLFALTERRRIDALRSGDTEQNAVRLAAASAGVQVGHNRGGSALEGFVGGGGFPQSACDWIRDGIRARPKAGDGPALNDVAVDELGLASDGRRGDVLGRCAGRCDDADGASGGDGRSCGQEGGGCVDLHGGVLLRRLTGGIP